MREITGVRGARRVWSVAAIAGLAAHAAAQVELRGRPGEIDAKVEGVSAAGVEVSGYADADGGRALLGWDLVRAVRGEKASEAAAFARLADDAWRAKVRLERGDVALAEPGFERIFAQRGEISGPTGLLAAQGLLACQVARGARPSAVPAWLECVRLSRARARDEAGAQGVGQGGVKRVWVGAGDGAAGSDMSEAVDAKTRLAPGLPPIWEGGSVGVRALALRSDWGVWEDGSDRVVAELAAVYRASAAASVDGSDMAVPEITSNDPGVRLAADVAVSVYGGKADRERARAALARRIDEEPGGWREVWCRLGLGRSLVRESDPAARRMGVVHLAHVWVRLGDVRASLTAEAMNLAADELERMGDAGGAAVIRAEFRSRFPANEGGGGRVSGAGAGVGASGGGS